MAAFPPCSIWPELHISLITMLRLNLMEDSWTFYSIVHLLKEPIFTSLGAIKRDELSPNSPELKLYKVPLNFLANLQYAVLEKREPEIIIDDIASSASVIKKYRQRGCPGLVEPCWFARGIFFIFSSTKYKKRR